MGVHSFPFEGIEGALGQRYVVESEIAVGGQGAVFKATRIARPDGSETSDPVALKLHLYRSQDIRVQREIAAMENLSNPHLARLIEHGFCDVAGKHTHYVAWEFVPGQTLSERLKSGRLMESEVLPIGRDVAAAIAAIWTRRIVHGDIKPSNIVLNKSGGAVLIDLGAARHLEEDNSPDARRPFGTLGYFSPEQARGEAVLSCASDVFSLGVVMLQCLLGRHPTDYSQSALSDGVRANAANLAVSVPLLCALEKMLSAQPGFRPMPAGLSSNFERLHQNLSHELATGAYKPVKPGKSSG